MTMSNAARLDQRHGAFHEAPHYDWHPVQPLSMIVLHSRNGHITVEPAIERPFLELLPEAMLRSCGEGFATVRHQVYRREDDSTYRPSGKDAADPKWSLQGNPGLWSLQGQSYEAWVRNLAYAMLLQAKEPTLAMCQHMIVRKAQLAELMLPHILADLAHHQPEDTMASISSQLSAGLLSPSAPAHVKAIQLILTCLDHLRNLHLNAVLGMDAEQRRKSTSGVGGSSTQGRSSTRSGRAGHGDGSKSPAAWSKQYWLEVDYLLVAAAALKCSAYFTALLYVEHWIEEQYGRLQLGDRSPTDKASFRSCCSPL